MQTTTIQAYLEVPERYQIKTFEERSSTNDELYQLAQKGAAEWTVVVAESQTAGKGRMERQWHSPPGKGLWFSILLRPQIKFRCLNLINLLTAYTLACSLEKASLQVRGDPLLVHLKWPNDLWIARRKLSGILLESSTIGKSLAFVVIGIGLNVNQEVDDFPEMLQTTATSLKMATGHRWPRERILAGFLEHFYENYYHHYANHFQGVVDLYKSKVLGRGKDITVSDGRGKITGRFLDITAEGYLILEQKQQQKLITTGDVFGC